MIHFDGDRRGSFLGHWHVATESVATYPVTFGVAIFGSVNPFHYTKATTHQVTWHGFLLSIDRGLEALKIEIKTDLAS
jgi:hypothetical protein